MTQQEGGWQCAVYDHTILIDDKQIRVMETEKEAIALIRREGWRHGES